MPQEAASRGPERVALVAAAAAAAASWAVAVPSRASLLHYDARAHLVVARRVLDSVTPGWIQLGAVWLPLPHVVNVLAAQNDFLYRTGLFASALGLAAFVAGLAALGRTARIATGDGWAAAVAIAVPALNPAWLYLAATPLTEPLFFGLVCFLALFVTRWRQRGRWRDLAAAAAFSAMACLVRYEAWPVAVLAAIAALWCLPAGVPRRNVLVRGVSVMIGGGLLLPVALFAIHSWVSTERVLYVIDAQDLTRPRGQIVDSALLLLVGTAGAFGPPAAILGLACLALVLWRRAPAALVAGALAGPGAVTFVAYFAGHPAKARYPLLLAPAFALAIALATRGRRSAQIVALAVAAAQALTVPFPLPVIVESLRSHADDVARRPEVEAFRRRYRGGRILASMGLLAPVVFDLQIPIREIVHEGNGNPWANAVVDPARYVKWVLIAPGDILDGVRQYRPRFPEGFVPVGRIGSAVLYESEADVRRGEPAAAPGRASPSG